MAAITDAKKLWGDGLAIVGGLVSAGLVAAAGHTMMGGRGRLFW
jgi:hypothetical protein